MLTRRFAFRAAAVSGGLTLLMAVFQPAVFVFFMAGGVAPQFGSGSLLVISPAAAVILMFVIGMSLGAAIVSEPHRQGRWLGPTGWLLLGFALLATAYTFSPLAVLGFGFHPAGMAAIALSGLFLIVAARLGRRVGNGPA
jgi:hypothetical protein